MKIILCQLSQKSYFMFCLQWFCVYACLCLTGRNPVRGFLYICLYLEVVINGQWVVWAPTRPTASHLLMAPLRMKVHWLWEFVLCEVREHLLKQVHSLWKEKKGGLHMGDSMRVWRERVKTTFWQVLIWHELKQIPNQPRQTESIIYQESPSITISGKRAVPEC